MQSEGKPRGTMRKIVCIAGMIASLVMLAVSGAMNWHFGHSLSTTEFDAQLLGAASAASDALKALAPFFIFAAWGKGHWVKSIAATLLWLVCLSYSLTSALGFAAVNRADTTGIRQQQSNTYAAAILDRDTIAAKMTWIPAHRPQTAVAQEITVWQASRLYDLSKQCAEPGRAMTYCTTLGHLKSELASATEAEALQIKLDAINQRIGAAQVVTSADPQVDALAGVVEQVRLVAGYEPATEAELSRTTQRVKAALLIALALLVEIGSSLGLYVSSAAWPTSGNVSREMGHAYDDGSPKPSPVPLVRIVPEAPLAALPPPAPPAAKFKVERLIAAKGRLTLVQNVLQSYNEWALETGHPAMHLSQLQQALMQAQVTCEVHEGRLCVAGFTLVKSKARAA